MKAFFHPKKVVFGQPPPRHIEPHELYSVLENGTEVPIEGINFNPKISLYISLRGNNIRFREHDSPYVLISYRLGGQSVYYQPVYEFTQDGVDMWLRIADEVRTRRPSAGKNSSPPDEVVEIFVPQDVGKVFYVLEFSEHNSARRQDIMDLEMIAERVYPYGR